MEFIKYEQARPVHIREMLEKAPVAYVPLGALEWHGEHAPLGLDGVKARLLCESAAALTGGVVFPPMFWGAFDTMPFPFTLRYKKAPMRRMVRETLAQLGDWGFKVIVLLTGHYPPSQGKMLKKECRRFNKKKKALAIGCPEQNFALDLAYYGDHAAMWETSIMMAIDEDQVDLSAMPEGLGPIERMVRFGVMGQDPVSKSSREKGEQAINLIAKNLSDLVLALLENPDEKAIEKMYSGLSREIRKKKLKVGYDAFGVDSLLGLAKFVWTSARLAAIRKKMEDDE